MAETGDLAPMYLSVTLDDRRDTLGSKMGESILSRCTNDVNRLTIRVTPLVDDPYLTLAGAHMTRFASLCEREEVHVCWETVWKDCVGITCCMFWWSQSWNFSPFFRSLIENCRA